MEWLITNAISAWLIPPGSLLLVALLGLVLTRRYPLLGRALLFFGLATLYALSTALLADSLRGSLEPVPHAPLTDAGGQAIVVLGGGTHFAAPEFGGDTVNGATLARLRYAAHLQRASGKPILVTGGSPQGNTISEAEQMKEVLVRDFHVPVEWVETGSNNTLENARRSYRLLAGSGVRRIYLVTHAWHVPRARLAFERAGFAVIPAPTGYATRHRLTMLDFLPDADALFRSSQFFREAIGLGWYHLRFLFGH